MREYLNQVEPVKVETELGTIYVTPSGCRGVSINAPHLTVDGVPLQASGYLVSADGFKWSFLEEWDPKTQRFSTAADALRARLVDGRDADIIVLGKIAATVRPAVERLAQTNSGLFLEAERRQISNDILKLEAEIERSREKIQEKEAKLAGIQAKLPGR